MSAKNIIVQQTNSRVPLLSALLQLKRPVLCAFANVRLQTVAQIHTVWYYTPRSCLSYTNCGVLRGSVIGHLRVLMNINDISDKRPSSIFLLATDTTLYFSSKCPSYLHQVLLEDL